IVDRHEAAEQSPVGCRIADEYPAGRDELVNPNVLLAVSHHPKRRIAEAIFGGFDLDLWREVGARRDQLLTDLGPRGGWNSDPVGMEQGDVRGIENTLDP